MKKMQISVRKKLMRSQTFALDHAAGNRRLEIALSSRKRIS
jgi:hypothetical protein